MKCCKKLRRATLFLVVLLVVRLQHVDCRLLLPQPQNVDPCENLGEHSVPCNTAGSPGALAVTIVSSLISAVILLLPINRVKALQLRRSETDTLFWWSIFLGVIGYGLWSIYFIHCYRPHGSNFYILLACIFGAVVYAGFLFVATRKTTTVGDIRVGFTIVVPLGLFILAGFLKLKERHYIGWVSLGFSVLSHLCRIESTDYHGEFDILVFLVSLVGSVNSFLWLIHPQLCLSMEYKANSYIAGVLRGGEAFYWCSRAVARFLWRFEGVILNAADPAVANALAAPVDNVAPAINALAAAPVDNAAPAINAQAAAPAINAQAAAPVDNAAPAINALAAAPVDNAAPAINAQAAAPEIALMPLV